MTNNNLEMGPVLITAAPNELMDGKVLNRQISAIGTVLAKTDAKVHELGLHALQHANIHGDTGYVQRLVEALAGGNISQLKAKGAVGKRGYYWLGFKQWVELYSPCRPDDKGVWKLMSKSAKNYVEFNIGDAAENPFWTIIEQKEPKPLTLEAILKIIEGLGGRVEKAEEAGRFTGNGPATVERLTAIANYAKKQLATVPAAANDGDEPIVEQAMA